MLQTFTISREAQISDIVRFLGIPLKYPPQPWNITIVSPFVQLNVFRTFYEREKMRSPLCRSNSSSSSWGRAGPASEVTFMFYKWTSWSKIDAIEDKMTIWNVDDVDAFHQFVYQLTVTPIKTE